MGSMIKFKPNKKRKGRGPNMFAKHINLANMNSYSDWNENWTKILTNSLPHRKDRYDE